MNTPIIADNKPVVLELKAGTYYWCSCGQSANAPYCDGSHKDSGFAPLKFTLEENKKVALCQCKHTNDTPFCDGAHINL